MPAMASSTTMGVLLLALAGCGAGGGELVGSWIFASEQCNGEDIAVAGYSSRLDVSEGQYTATIEGGGCSVTTRNARLTDDGELLPTTGTVECSPDPCAVAFTIEGQNVQLTCPSDFPVTGVTSHLLMRGDDLYLESESGADACELRFVRN